MMMPRSEGPRPGPAPPGAVSPGLACDAELATLFAPQPLAGSYQVCSTAAPLDEVVADAGPAGASRAGAPHDAPAAAPPRFGRAELVEPLEAFGEGGSYDRAKLARLYGGTRVRVAHGWRADADGRFESFTLISPHPDRTLTRLERGTLIIRYTLQTRPSPGGGL